MSDYAKQVKVLEGPWERQTFPNGVESTDVISRKTITMYKQDGYLCEMSVTRTYTRDGEDYHDVTTHKRIIKLD
jgi:hypothetical protein